ncbi:protein phosphatase 2C domain-containing protein [Dictyobacter arantiisoli]|uniref:PPM-type phosphatase domain-containing protein n=1 Tax=Dictyobacter arantiisoli TaxID=2014874 RepID=A0A5A5T5U4_9CHLR|nr:protein phosphatase 2C domain-containing protein [Dictyobacter arantiisoli]GCF06556.1 hypothetical protein KDI_01200 [Dictyobacter arantiisoli]
MLCPLCHTQNRDNARFCKGCGQLLIADDAHEVSTGQPATVEQPDSIEHAEIQRTPSSQHANTTPEAGSDTDTNPQPTSTEAPEYIETTVPAAEELPQAPSTDATPASEPATTEAENSQPDVSTEEDISQAPTQILTQQQMLEFHARRWKQEAEHEQQLQQIGAKYDDIADAPTLLITPQTQAEEVSSETTPEQTHTEGAEGAPPQNNVSEAPAQEEENVEPIINDHEPEAEAKTTGTEPAETGTEANATPTITPAAEVGTIVGGRYEIAQVLNTADNEHVYVVTDHQGYQHCWNCSSEQNAEGDEFCIDCGAELLNASYVLHEYSATAQQGDEAQVLQGQIVNTFVDNENTYVVEQPQTTQTAFPNGVHLIGASNSDAGTVRRSEPNEDSTLTLTLERVHESISTPVGLYVVADGMGGHANGQGASRTTIALIAERVTRELLLAPLQAEKAGEAVPATDDETYKELLRGAIEGANTTLCQINQKDKSDMGSTLTGFMIIGDHAYIFNVGDSRTYMLRDEKLYQLTNDHSLVGQLVAGGLIEPDDVYTHPQRNQIFRSIGDKQNVQVDLFTQQIHPGDILLSCSDGLWEMVRDPQITDLLNQAPDPQAACTQLIEVANANGGEDNVSAVVVFVR